MIVQISLDVGGVILTAAALSFLGLGAQDPTPEWGLMVAQGQALLHDPLVARDLPRARDPVTAFAFNLLGDGLRDAPRPAAGDLHDPDEGLATDPRPARCARGRDRGSLGRVAWPSSSRSDSRGEIVGLVGESRLGQVDDRAGDARPRRARGRDASSGASGSTARSSWARPSGACARSAARRIAVIFQSPSRRFNPVFRVGDMLRRGRCGCTAPRATRRRSAAEAAMRSVLLSPDTPAPLPAPALRRPGAAGRDRAGRWRCAPRCCWPTSRPARST